MTTAEQLGAQLKQARIEAGFSVREFAAHVRIPASTIEGYEAGTKIPAHTFLRIAEALKQYVFDVDGKKYRVERPDEQRSDSKEQMNFNFSAGYTTSHATVKIGPGTITVAFDARKVSNRT